MESSLQDLSPYLMTPALLVLLGFLLVALFAVQGYSMKLSVNLLDAGPIGFFYGLLTSFVISIGSGISSAAIMLATGCTNQWVLMCYSLAAGVIILALMIRCNPFKAFFAYLAHLFFSTIGTMGIAIAGFIFIYIGFQTNMIEQPSDSSGMLGSIESNWQSDEPGVTNAVFGSELPEAEQPTLEPANESFIPPINLGGGKIQTNPFSQ